MMEEVSMQPAYTVYGDESIDGSMRHVVYALLAVPSTIEASVIETLSEVKTRWKGKPDSVIHCKSLLAPSERLKTDWAHLKDQEPIQFLYEVVLSLGRFGLRTVVGYVDAQDHPIMVGVGDIPNAALENPRQLIPSAYIGASGVLCSQSEFSGRCIFYADPLTDMVLWYNRNKNLGSLIKTNMVQFPSMDMKTVFAPSPFPNGTKPVMLELADILAYASMRVFSMDAGSTKYSDRFLKKMFEVMAPQVARLHPVAQSGDKG